MRRWFKGLFAAPMIRRIGWHLRRIHTNLDAKFYRSLFIGLTITLALAALAVTVFERDVDIASFGQSFYWALTTVIGAGDSGYVSSPVGWVVSWLLNLFGVGIVAAMTGALVGFVIDFLLKEGQGMGAAGFSDHVVVCGWNSTARDLIDELKSDDYGSNIVLIDSAERNPAGDGVYFIRGDGVNDDDLRRAGITTARAAIICPKDGTDDADMHSILIGLAIESLAPEVRTVVEVNNPKHVEHFKRADVDEVLVTSKLASRLLARTALHPGLGDLVTDMVSGGVGSELYRIPVPERLTGRSVLEVASLLLQFNDATLLAVARNGSVLANPGAQFMLVPGDEMVLMAESMERLASLSEAGTAQT
ncbi:MAG TPA: NAD-binding protein [Acidimicrobiia bacterium]|nr:NAD-binding protein [Acidimicrobiia bacterium]